MFYNISTWCQCHKTFFGVNSAQMGQSYADSGVNYGEKWFVTFAQVGGSVREQRVPDRGFDPFGKDPG
jgi:hypothetical protein